MADPDIPVDPPLLSSTWMDPERSASASLDISGSNGAGASRTVTSVDVVKTKTTSTTTLSTARGSQKRQRRRRATLPERSAVAVDVTSQQGRTLAAHAFLHGARCGDRRAGALLGVCRQTAGRDRARRPVTTPPVLERAQVLIAASAGRGSTAEERAAAVAWLTAGATPAEVPMSEERQESSMHASLTRDQVDACGRLHRRIRVRTEVIRRVLEPDVERCEQIEVVLDLLIDIRASETLETLLEDARPVTRPMA